MNRESEYPTHLRDILIEAWSLYIGDSHCLTIDLLLPLTEQILTSGKSMYALCDSLVVVGRWYEAIDLLKRVDPSEFPKNGFLLSFCLGRAYEYSGSFEKAMNCYTNAIKQNADGPRPQHVYAAATMNWRLGRIAEAVQLFSDSFRHDREKVFQEREVCSMMAVLFQAADDRSPAIANARRALVGSGDGLIAKRAKAVLTNYGLPELSETGN